MSNPWWRRRKKKNPWYNDIYEELEKLGNMIDETIQKAFENSSKNSPAKHNHIKNFSMKFGPDGKPLVRELNNRQPTYDETVTTDDPEPLVDIIEKPDLLVVLVAFSGVSKNDIDLRVTETCLIINVGTDDFEWYDELNLPTKIKPKSATASYKNGVLEVRLEKIEKVIRNNKISVKK